MNRLNKAKSHNRVDNFYSSIELKRALVRGPNFTVRVCLNVKTKSVQALKIIDTTDEPSSKNVEEASKRALTEAELMRKCSGHPYIVKLLNSIETPSHVLILMEAYPPTNLYEMLSSNGMLSLGQTKKVGHQLLEALQFIHGKMIVHRNVKLENVLVDDDLRVKLGSFELACCVDSDTELKEFTGSLSYVAPELVGLVFNKSEDGHGRPIDVWAVGVVMATLLTGNYPFWDLNLPKMMQTIAMAHINFAKPHWSNVNDSCRDLLVKLLDSEASKRISASVARSHPFFTSFNEEVKRSGHVSAVRKRPTLKVVAICVRAAIRLSALGQLQRHAKRINTLASIGSSYSVRYFRRFIDSTAAQMYNHWIGDSDKQKRVLLFQNSQKQFNSRIKL